MAAVVVGVVTVVVVTGTVPSSPQPASSTASTKTTARRTHMSNPSPCDGHPAAEPRASPHPRPKATPPEPAVPETGSTRKRPDSRPDPRQPPCGTSSRPGPARGNTPGAAGAKCPSRGYRFRTAGPAYPEPHCGEPPPGSTVMDTMRSSPFLSGLLKRWVPRVQEALGHLDRGPPFRERSHQGLLRSGPANPDEGPIDPESVEGFEVHQERGGIGFVDHDQGVRVAATHAAE